MLNDIQLIALLATILQASARGGSGIRNCVDTAEQAYHEILRRNLKHNKKHVSSPDPETCEQCKTMKFAQDLEPRIIG